MEKKHSHSVDRRHFDWAHAVIVMAKNSVKMKRMKIALIWCGTAFVSTRIFLSVISDRKSDSNRSKKKNNKINGFTSKMLLKHSSFWSILFANFFHFFFVFIFAILVLLPFTYDGRSNIIHNKMIRFINTNRLILFLCEGMCVCVCLWWFVTCQHSITTLHAIEK